MALGAKIGANAEAKYSREHSDKKIELILNDHIFKKCAIKRDSCKRGLLLKHEEILYVHFDGKNYRLLSVDPKRGISKITI